MNPDLRWLFWVVAVGISLTSASASADPNTPSIRVHIATPVAGRTEITLSIGSFRRAVTVGPTPTPADLEPLFVGLPPLHRRAFITPEEDAPYATVVAVMDALTRHRIVEFSLAPPRGPRND